MTRSSTTAEGPAPAQSFSRVACFAGLVAVSVLVSWRAIGMLVQTVRQHDEYIHIISILPIVLALVYLKTRRAGLVARYSVGAAAPFFVAALACMWAASGPRGAWYLMLSILALVLIWTGGVIAFYGVEIAWLLLFPLALLFLLVPVPGELLDRFIYFLQVSSAQTTYALFRLADVPVLKNGMQMYLPGVNIEVAKECSGIRSTTMLLITGLVLAHLLVRSRWQKLGLALLLLPLAIAKNALRIFIMSVMAVYVDEGYLHGRLHYYSGVIFFVLSLVLLGGLIWLLRRREARQGKVPLAKSTLANATL